MPASTAPQLKNISIRINNGVALLKYNRPAAGNALNKGVFEVCRSYVAFALGLCANHVGVVDPMGRISSARRHGRWHRMRSGSLCSLAKGNSLLPVCFVTSSDFYSRECGVGRSEVGFLSLPGVRVPGNLKSLRIVKLKLTIGQGWTSWTVCSTTPDRCLLMTPSTLSGRYFHLI